MQEFSSISVSTYDPDALVGQLNEQAVAGWNVMSIVPTGSTITAYLTRETDAAPASTVESVAEEPAAALEAEQAPEPEPAAPEPATTEVEPAPEPAADEPFMATAEPEPEPEPEPAPEPASAAAAAAPAGWYADPSSRYELRYWDGGTWTEHVSRGGQQYTDPPVA